MKKALIFGMFTILVFLTISSCGDKSLIYENADVFVEEAKLNVKGVTVNEAKIFFDTADYYVLLDVREPQEFHPGYITDAVNIPRGIIEFNISNEKFWESQSSYLPKKDEIIYVYCKKGKRSILAANTLSKMGYKNVKYIIGGFKQWELTFPNDYQFDEVEEGAHAEKEEVGGC